MVLEVLEPGLLATVQDGGRPAAVGLGVPLGGACDPWSLAVANLLLDNAPAAPALEITLAGTTLGVLESCVVALAGADLGAHVPEERRTVRPGTAHRLQAGTHLAFTGAGRGARAYLGLTGGVAVPSVLGSTSTCLVGAFGGHEGRPLARGDRIHPARAAAHLAAGRHWPATLADPLALAGPLRLLAPPSTGRAAERARRSLLEATWTVAGEADRMGLRLDGPRLPATRGSGSLPSRPVVWGTVQVPPDGTPIVLLADHQTVGGYPIAGIVARADHPRLAQLRPGDPVRFEPITIAAAQEALRTQVALLRAGAGELARDPWDALAEFAR
jgi:biotin-dependent carboxylase-like uncharacterized protein